MMSQGASVSNIKREFLLPNGQVLQLARQNITLQPLGLAYFYGAHDVSTFAKAELTSFTLTRTFLDSLTPRLTALEWFV